MRAPGADSLTFPALRDDPFSTWLNMTPAFAGFPTHEERMTMTLVHHTRLAFDASHPQVRHSILDIQQLHRVVMGGFPLVDGMTDARASLGILFAERAEDSKLVLLVQSMIAGDWSTQPGFLGAKQWDVVVPDTGVRPFSLTASPVKRPSDGPTSASGHRRRVVLTDPAEQVEWLRRQGKRGGFELVGTPDVRPLTPRFSDLKSKPLEQRTGKNDRFSVRATSFTGHLRVIDAAAFAATVKAGVGPQRAYGCGLLLVR